MKDNMQLWKSVCKTDPNDITNASVSGQKRKTVRSQHRKMLATREFGIYGSGWGVEPDSEKYERITIGDTQLLQYNAVMFYEYQGERGSLPIAACIKEVYMVKRGTPGQYLKVDDEAIKKVRTDALTKGLADLGFNADIHLGEHDDQNYTNQVRDEIEQDKLDQQEAERIEALKDYKAWKVEALDSYKKENLSPVLSTMLTGHVRRALKEGDNKGASEFQEAHDKRIAELKAGVNS